MASPDQRPKVICPTCKALPTGRNLVVALDGTMNQFRPLGKNSNVIEIYGRVERSKDQLLYYNSGIGTYANPSGRLQVWKWVTNLVDLALAPDFHIIVLAAYRWLSEQHEPGDKIFLFGFSRGAYLVRVLAAMIDTVGLILKGNFEQIPFAYELYAHSDKKYAHLAKKYARLAKILPKEKYQDLAMKLFKAYFSRPDVKIHFVGVWDTVSSIGLFRSKDLPKTRTVGHICYFRHALALDEKRVKFSPEDVFRSLDSGKRITDNKSNNDAEHVKEVWFAGCHSDVGGGSKQELRITMTNDIPRFWMLYEAWKKGLKVPPANLGFNFESIVFFKPQNSLKRGWYILECLPFLSRCDDFTSKPFRWIFPHFGAPRYIYPHQKIHASVKAFLNKEGESSLKSNIRGDQGKEYQPQAQFVPRNPQEGTPSWNDIKTCAGRMESDLIEQGIYGDDIATEQAQQLRNGTNVWHAFFILNSHKNGVPAFVEAGPETFRILLDMLKSNKYPDEMSRFIMKLARHKEEKVPPMYSKWRLDKNNKPFLETLLEVMQ